MYSLDGLSETNGTGEGTVAGSAPGISADERPHRDTAALAPRRLKITPAVKALRPAMIVAVLSPGFGVRLFCLCAFALGIGSHLSEQTTAALACSKRQDLLRIV